MNRDFSSMQKLHFALVSVIKIEACNIKLCVCTRLMQHVISSI